MTTSRRSALALLATLPLTAKSFAQGRYPTQPIKLVVPVPAGGQTDVFARLIAQRAEKALGQPIVVDNRAGANTLIATEYVAKQPADGYTLLFNITNIVQNAILLPKVNYDPFTDFEPICNCYSLAGIFAVPTSGPKTLNEFLQKARTRETFYATPGHASSLHFFGEQLARAAGATMTHVPYKGEVPLVPDLVAGRIDAGFMSSFTALQYEREGKLRSLATTGLRRLKGMPELPTFQEQGVAGLAAGTFGGFFAPAKTPADIIQRLNTVLMDAATQPDLRGRMVVAGLDPAQPNTPAQFTALMRQAHKEWSDIRRNSAIRLES